MRLMIVGDHDRICEGLSNNSLPVIFDCEDDLKAQLLVLMPTIASDTHWQFHLHGTCWLWLRAGRLILGDLGPLLDLVRIEDNDTPFFISLEYLFFFGLLLLLS